MKKMYLHKRSSDGKHPDYGFVIYISLVLIFTGRLLLEFFNNI
ncbi:MAG: hypothetical protein ABWY16_01530 [Pedobacter sp.]